MSFDAVVKSCAVSRFVQAGSSVGRGALIVAALGLTAAPPAVAFEESEHVAGDPALITARPVRAVLIDLYDTLVWSEWSGLRDRMCERLGIEPLELLRAFLQHRGRDAMKRAIEELKKQQRENASKEQDEAIRKLMQAKEQIEEILRQLREEEREMFLTMLEARFQNMLRLQLQINTETVRLDKVPADQREARHISKATDLSRDQRDNALEADRALVLLKEEKQRSYRNYHESFEKTHAEIVAKLRHPSGQLALLNPSRYSGPVTPLRPMVLPYGALDFDAMQTRLHPAQSRIDRLSAEIPATYIVFDLLVELHRRRWENLGQRGLFDSPRYAAFHREVAAPMLAKGQLRLHWLTLGGRPAAVEYHFAGGGVSSRIGAFGRAAHRGRLSKRRACGKNAPRILKFPVPPSAYRSAASGTDGPAVVVS